MRHFIGDLMCAKMSQASTPSGFYSRPASWHSHVHGAVLSPLHLLPLSGLKDRHPEGPDRGSLLRTGAHDCGVQEPGQDTGL